MKLKETSALFESARRGWSSGSWRTSGSIPARYSVTAPDGSKIGQLGKVFKQSLLRSTWKIYEEGEQIGWAQETSATIAILRRIIGLFALIPLIGEFIAMIPIPYHFEYFLARISGSAS